MKFSFQPYAVSSQLPHSFSSLWWETDLPEDTQKGAARRAPAESTHSLLRPDHEQFLTVLDWLAVHCQLPDNLPGKIRLNFVEQFHCFDDTKDLSYLDCVSGFHEGRRARRGRFIERSNDRRLHCVQALFRGGLSSRRRRCAWWRWRRGRQASDFDCRHGSGRNREEARLSMSVHDRVFPGALDPDFNIAALQLKF